MSGVVASLKHWPSRSAWIQCFGWLLAISPILAALAWIGGFASFVPERDPLVWLRLSIVIFLVPALGEELLFRSLLVPPPHRPMPLWRWVVAVGLFVAWHPLQAVTFGPPWAAMFLDPWFLLAVAVLGGALVAQFRIAGSIWPCVISHWLVVLCWKLIFGGPTV
jgi:uncharacterized protein